MKANFYIENQRFCLAFDRYVIEEINGKDMFYQKKKLKVMLQHFLIGLIDI